MTLRGAKALAKAVSGLDKHPGAGHWRFLTWRQGAACYFSNALAEGKNEKLEILRLQYNDITAAGLKGLAEAAKGALPALRKIAGEWQQVFLRRTGAVIGLQELFEERKGEIWGATSLTRTTGA